MDWIYLKVDYSIPLKLSKNVSCIYCISVIKKEELVNIFIAMIIIILLIYTKLHSTRLCAEHYTLTISNKILI